MARENSLLHSRANLHLSGRRTSVGAPARIFGGVVLAIALLLATAGPASSGVIVDPHFTAVLPVIENDLLVTQFIEVQLPPRSRTWTRVEADTLAVFECVRPNFTVLAKRIRQRRHEGAEVQGHADRNGYWVATVSFEIGKRIPDCPTEAQQARVVRVCASNVAAFDQYTGEAMGDPNTYCGRV